jgi:hypothetical protein
MDERESRQGTPGDRWFEGSGEPAPLPRGVSNSRRAARVPEARPANLLMWFLLAVMRVLVLAYT